MTLVTFNSVEENAAWSASVQSLRYQAEDCYDVNNIHEPKDDKTQWRQWCENVAMFINRWGIERLPRDILEACLDTQKHVYEEGEEKPVTIVAPANGN